jgi:hypothetical protein
MTREVVPHPMVEKVTAVLMEHARNRELPYSTGIHIASVLPYHSTGQGFHNLKICLKAADITSAALLFAAQRRAGQVANRGGRLSGQLPS